MDWHSKGQQSIILVIVVITIIKWVDVMLLWIIIIMLLWIVHQAIHKAIQNIYVNKSFRQSKMHAGTKAEHLR